MMRVTLALLSLIVVGTSAAQLDERGRLASPATNFFVLGISPYLEKSVKDEVFRSLVRLLVSDLPPNSSLMVYDAFQLKSITRINVPDSPAFRSPKTRANQFALAIGELRTFLGREHSMPSHSRLDFNSAVRLPQFLDFLSGTPLGSVSKARLLLLGSPLYQDPQEPGFSMADGFFPSDGHLTASREASVFGFTEKSVAPAGLDLYWVYFGKPWLSDLHEQKITRFWNLYLQRRGARLGALTGDFPTGMAAFLHDDLVTATNHWTIERDSKLEMLRVTRNIETADWLIRELPATAPPPPTLMIGPMKIGIRWKDNIDLDLYATPRPGAETLFFQHVRSPEGYYYKDHRSSPGKEYEFIEFDTPVDIRAVQAYVNFYRGRLLGGPRGEVRIEFDGRIYSLPFVIDADHGNRGQSGPSQDEFWTRIPVQELLRISITQHSGLGR